MDTGLTLGAFRERTKDLDDETLMVIQSHDADFYLGTDVGDIVVVATVNLDHIEYALLDIDPDDEAGMNEAVNNGTGLKAITLCANSY